MSTCMFGMRVMACVSANEFVSCIIHFIEGEIHRGYKKITLISDGCTYQNKNKILSSALADISKF